MDKTNYTDVCSFMDACEQERAHIITEKNNPFNSRLYLRLISEEFIELLTNIVKIDDYIPPSSSFYLTELKEDLDKLAERANRVFEPLEKINIADDLTDILYVVNGFAATLGIDLDKCWKEVHSSNMSKINPETGKADRDSNNKVIKGKGYFKPDLKKVLYDS